MVSFIVTVHSVPPRGVFVRILHENPETAGAKMNALCSIHDNRILHLNSIVCVHHVAVNGEAVNSNNEVINGQNT